MINIFSLILAIMTFITGVLWFLKKFKFFKKIPSNLNQVTYYVSFLDSLISIFPVLAIVFLIRSFLYEPFQIPSSSMFPTLFVGDFILVEKFSYGIKNPITQKKIFSIKKPKRGDVAVFKYPHNPKVDYIKRIIGLPGDEVIYDIEKKTVTIHPRCPHEELCNSFPVTYTDVPFYQMSTDFKNLYKKEKNFFNDNIFFHSKENLFEKNDVNIIIRNEKIGDKKHYILLENNNIHLLNNNILQSRWIVPNDQYFMLGDNRDNSSDSRYWGFVPEKNLVGKAVFIWMSLKKKENQFPTGIRFRRIGKIY